MSKQIRQSSDKNKFPFSDKHIVQSKNGQKSQQKQNTNNDDEEQEQSNNFITEIPVEAQKQIDKLREKHRKRMQEEREQYQESLEQREQEVEQNNIDEKDYIIQDQKVPIRFMKPDLARQESIAIIEQGKQRRQKMIVNNLSKLQNKLNQDAQKIDETIDLLRIEIVETQKEIKEKAKIEREQLQEYHSQMHKQIGDMYKMKHNILLNQQQIYISQMKQQNKRTQRSISESHMRKKDSLLQQSKVPLQSRIYDFVNQNGRESHRINNFNSGQRSEIIHSGLDDDESLYYSEERNFTQQDGSQEIPSDQYTFNPKPLYRKMEENYQSNIVLPEIQQREDVIKQRSEYYRKRMEPLKLFKDHEKKYEEVKEAKEKERVDKIQKNQEEQRQFSLEQHTKSQTYVRTQNEENQKKENERKKDIMQKILLDKQKNYQPSRSDHSRQIRSSSQSEISQSIHSNVKKIPINQIVQSNFEQMTEKERILKGIENHKADLAKKENIFRTKETSEDQSISDLIAFNSEKQQSNENQVLKRQKRKILTQKFHGDHSPLPEVFISDDFYSSEKKKSTLQDISQDLIEVRRGPQIAQFLTDIQLEQQDSHYQTKSISSIPKESPQKPVDITKNPKDKIENLTKKSQSNEKTTTNSATTNQANGVNSSNKKDPIQEQKQNNSSNLNDEQIQNYLNNRESIQKENRDKTPHVQKSNNRNSTEKSTEKQKQNNSTSIQKSIPDQTEITKNETNFKSPQKQINLNQNEKIDNKLLQPATAHFQVESSKPSNYNSHNVNKQKSPDNSQKKTPIQKQKPKQLEVEEIKQQNHQSQPNQQQQPIQDRKQINKGVSLPNLVKNTQLPAINNHIKPQVDEKEDFELQAKSKRIKRSPEKLINKEQQISENPKDRQLINNPKHDNKREQNEDSSDIAQMYRQFKQINSKSKRSASEMQHSRNGYQSHSLLGQESSRLITENNKHKYKDYMHDVKEKYKLVRNIDDWKKIEKNELLNNQQKITKLSEKVQYLDNKLQQMKDATKQNKGYQLQSESEQLDEDAILINSVQAKLAILNKLN